MKVDFFGVVHKNMFELLRGKKTIIISVLAIVWAIYGWYFGNLTSEMAQQTVFGALGMLGLRNAIANKK